MTDFLQRVSQAALGRTPAIQPLVGSHYAPSTLLPGYEMASSDIDQETRSLESAAASESASHDFATPTLPDHSGLNLAVGDGSERHAAGKPIGGPRFGQTLSSKDAMRSLSATSPQTSEDRVSTEGPAFHSMSAAGTSGVTGIVDSSRELAAPTSTQSVLDISDVNGGEANSQSGVQVNLQREDSLPRRNATAGSAFARRGNQELRDANDGKLEVHKSESNTPPEPVVDRQRLVGEIEPGRQKNHGDHVGPLIGDGLVDQLRSRRVAPRSPEPPRVLDNRNSTSTENVIRITIGRIDVRAVTPPLPPVKSSARPAPKLSLDEFLRQHNGRSR